MIHILINKFGQKSLSGTSAWICIFMPKGKKLNKETITVEQHIVSGDARFPSQRELRKQAIKERILANTRKSYNIAIFIIGGYKFYGKESA